MIKGIGVDICSISRMEELCLNQRFKDRVFTAKEQQYACNRGVFKASSLAGMFAAKEAFSKAVGTGIGKVSFLDVEVLHENSGKPVVATHGNAKKILENIGAKNIFVSISHEKDNAVAIVILED